MNSVLTSRVDRTLLHPVFLARLVSMIDDLAELKRAEFWVVSGFRSYAAQTALFVQGRPGPDGKLIAGPKVTNSRAGESAHNFGIAADLCLDGYVDRAGLQPDWRPESYELLREFAPKHGLAWGGEWSSPDRPHVQMPHLITAAQLRPVREAYEAHGLVACWRAVDTLTP